jgi:glycosyltransferase involved in cell wall biosynthesis
MKWRCIGSLALSESTLLSVPMISVVMAVYNEAKQLQKTIESIDKQTLQDYELIIVDDCSTDETWQVLNAIQHPRLKLHRNASNQGQTASLNAGIGLASGRYFARHDAQDVSAAERFAKQAAFLDANPDVALVGSQVEWIDDRGAIIRHFEYPTGYDAIIARMREKNSFGHGAAMIRRSALERVGLYREAFLLAQDYDLWLRISEQFKVANLPETLYQMRFSTQMASIARNGEQNAYAALARQLAAERSESSGERTDLDAAARAIRVRYQAGGIAQRLERGGNFISWADRLNWWAGSAARYAWPTWWQAVATWPFDVRIWKFVARRLRDAVIPTDKKRGIVH